MSGYRYFVIHNGEGDTTVRDMDEVELLDHLGEDYWGELGVMTPEEFEHMQGDTNYWKGKLLIIKGTVARVIPPGDWRVE